ncbi:Osmosensitive K+ channel histidine kinase KdpD [Dissulfuribacter thermophilus]|uniref:histidine kinase n=1 Tax=Dissulfuribacter thermophilus TaxID=1156395 RepID=A0A1B9F5P5_9BACT|nr:PAS domain-containing sensor histidine kinase [Dissulfuribacter thermophilus]OCC15267.1 Osmosensitive K+ channel histidine kinase KdpD [Dissulfuribacter thermophilus]
MKILKDGIGHEELCNLIIPSLPIGFVAIDTSGTILEFNREAEKLTGYTRNEAVGKRCNEVLKSSLCDAKCPISEEFEQTKIIKEDTFLINKSGTRIPVSITVTSITDPTGKQYGIIELLRDRREQEKLEQHRDILISMFAHDLKAPVAIAGGFILRLLNGKAGELNAKQKTYLETVYREIQRLENYIHVILEILRLEAGKVPLSLEECSLEEIIEEIIDGIKVKAGEKKIKIMMQVPDELTIIKADSKQLQRAITNLLDNAIKFSPKSSEVYVKVKPVDDSVILEVEDRGPGIDEKDLPHVFDPFFKGKTKVEEGEEPGSGLGLAVVKSIIEAHGGEVWAQNRPEGGMKFWFKVPKHGGQE